MDIILILAHVSFLSPLIPLAISIRLKSPPGELRLIQYLLIASFVFDALSLILARRGFNNYPVANFFFLVQTWLLFKIYIHHLPRKKGILKGLLIAFSVFFILNYTFIQQPFLMNSYSMSISGTIFMFVAVYFFYNLLKELPETYLHTMPMFWINVAVLVYFSGNIYLFIFNNYFTGGREGDQRIMWVIHNTLNIVKNLLFLVAIWQHLRRKELN